MSDQQRSGRASALFPTRAERERLERDVPLSTLLLEREAGVADSEDLARQLHLLYDGAGVSARTDRDPSAATTARTAAAALLDAAVKDTQPADPR